LKLLLIFKENIKKIHKKYKSRSKNLKISPLRYTTMSNTMVKKYLPHLAKIRKFALHGPNINWQ
jgi:hypothetical protein